MSDAYCDALAEIFDEACAARLQFPAFHSSHEGYAVIAEELDELWDDVKANNVEHAIGEAVQVGAMALRFIADMRALTVSTGGTIKIVKAPRRLTPPGVTAKPDERFDMNDSIHNVHDDDAGVLCACEYCTFADWAVGAHLPRVRCEDAPCCGCCDGGLL